MHVASTESVGEAVALGRAFVASRKSVRCEMITEGVGSVGTDSSNLSPCMMMRLALAAIVRACQRTNPTSTPVAGLDA